MQAIVLAGGLGTRLRSVVADLPKPMAPVAGRPFLAWILDRLVASRVRPRRAGGGLPPRGHPQHFGHAYRGMALHYSVEDSTAGHRRCHPAGGGPGRRLAGLRAQRRHFPGARLPGDARRALQGREQMSMAVCQRRRRRPLRRARAAGRPVRGFLEKGPRGPGSSTPARICCPTAFWTGFRAMCRSPSSSNCSCPEVGDHPPGRVRHRGPVHRHRRARGLRPRAASFPSAAPQP